MRFGRTIVAVTAAGALSLMGAAPASAAMPNGLKGYEGQPGHQAGKMGPHVPKKCAPGQHGNPKPGFKPGACK